MDRGLAPASTIVDGMESKTLSPSPSSITILHQKAYFGELPYNALLMVLSFRLGLGEFSLSVLCCEERPHLGLLTFAHMLSHLRLVRVASSSRKLHGYASIIDLGIQDECSSSS
jgi:hypothetical protein